MLKLGLWQIKDNKPDRIVPSRIELEQNLEDWIEADPLLLQEGLTIIGRQVRLEGGIADLLGIDSQGRWVVIEIKREQILRKTIAQAIDYASCISELSNESLIEIVKSYHKSERNSQSGFNLDEILKTINGEEREITVFVVGAGHTPGLERIINFLSKNSNLSVTLVSFEVFQLKNGETLLIKELTESNNPPVQKAKKKSKTAEGILKLADQNNVGIEFRKIHKNAIENNLSVRPYKHSIMYTHPSNRTVMLYTVWADKTPNQIVLYSSSKAFSQYFPITEEEALDALGPDGWRTLTKEGVDEFTSGLSALLKSIDEDA